MEDCGVGEGAGGNGGNGSVGTFGNSDNGSSGSAMEGGGGGGGSDGYLVVERGRFITQGVVEPPPNGLDGQLLDL